MTLEEYTYNIRFEIGTNIKLTYKTDNNSLDCFYRELEKRAEESKKQKSVSEKANNYFPEDTADNILQKVKNKK